MTRFRLSKAGKNIALIRPERNMETPRPVETQYVPSNEMNEVVQLTAIASSIEII